jgi:hypothetical protein
VPFQFQNPDFGFARSPDPKFAHNADFGKLNSNFQNPILDRNDTNSDEIPRTITQFFKI